MEESSEYRDERNEDTNERNEDTNERNEDTNERYTVLMTLDKTWHTFRDSVADKIDNLGYNNDKFDHLIHTSIEASVAQAIYCDWTRDQYIVGLSRFASS